MLSSVSGISFKGETQDLINSPGKFSMKAPDIPQDSFDKSTTEEKSSSNGLKVAIGSLVAGLAIFAGLGYAVKNKHIEKVDVDKVEGFFKKAWAYVKNAGVYVGEKAEKSYDWAASLFKNSSKETTKAS